MDRVRRLEITLGLVLCGLAVLSQPFSEMSRPAFMQTLSDFHLLLLTGIGGAITAASAVYWKRLARSTSARIRDGHVVSVRTWIALASAITLAWTPAFAVLRAFCVLINRLSESYPIVDVVSSAISTVVWLYFIIIGVRWLLRKRT